MLTVYSKKPCVQCDAVYRWLEKRPQVEHKIVMLADAPEKLAQFQKMGLLQAPILEAEDGSLSSGFDVDFLGKFV